VIEFMARLQEIIRWLRQQVNDNEKEEEEEEEEAPTTLDSYFIKNNVPLTLDDFASLRVRV
jgi:hypothetical protein